MPQGREAPCRGAERKEEEGGDVTYGNVEEEIGAVGKAFEAGGIIREVVSRVCGGRVPEKYALDWTGCVSTGSTQEG
jgi:hypothetical protein